MQIILKLLMSDLGDVLQEYRIRRVFLREIIPTHDILDRIC